MWQLEKEDVRPKEDNRMSDKFGNVPTELRPQPSCLLCNEERPCNWACLGTDSILAGAMWIADEMLAEFEQAEAEAPGVAFVTKRINDSF
jgi:hypothetical protein